MSSSPVVETLDVLTQVRACFGPRLIVAIVDPFDLQRVKETLDHRVIPTIAPPTHARRDAVAHELVVIRPTRVLPDKCNA